MIKFRVLGTTTLQREDGDFDHSFLAGSKRVALFTYLMLARPPGYKRRDKLVALFWPEMGQKSARNALSNMLYHMRNSLGEEALTNRGTEEIRINPEKVWCDAIAFEEALDEEKVRDALDLYHGDLLPAFHVTEVSNEFMSWLDSERERLRRKAAEAAWKLADRAAKANNINSARRLAKKAVSYSEFSEEVYRQLIIFLHKIGDRQGAIKAYEEFATHIREEWDMEPSGKLKGLIKNIDKDGPQNLIKSAPLEPTQHSDSSAVNAASHEQDQPHVHASLQKSVSEENASQWTKKQWWAGVMVFLLIAIITAWTVWPGIFTDDDSSSVPDLSVAVLPFTYIGAEDSTSYFSLGMTEEILTRLAQVGELSVISRTSVMQYQNTKKSLREIAEELGVAAIVEGSVLQEGNRVRIHAQLIDAKTDHHLWSKRYDRKLKNIFAVQSDIAKAIAGELKAELAPGVEDRIERAPTEDLAAYELFLRGREYFNHTIKEENKTGIDLLQQAIKRDPEFALARATLAKAYAKDTWIFGANSQQSDSAVAEAERAVILSPDLDEAHVALGYARMIKGQFNKSIDSFNRAIELNPNNWEAINDLGIIYLQTGRLALAIQNWKRVLKGNPAGAHVRRFNLALAYRILGLLERAEQANRLSLALEPDFILAIVNQAHVDLFRGDVAAATEAVKKLASDHESNPYALMSAGWIYILAGEPERASEPLERAYELSPTAYGEGYVRVRLGYTLWQAGERERAVKLFEEFEHFAADQLEKGNEYGMLPYSMAAMYAVRGETELALRWFERAVVEAGWPYELTAIHDPMLVSLHDEERFQILVDIMRERNEESRQQLARDEGLEQPEQLQPKKVN